MRKVYIAGIPSTVQDDELKSLLESLAGTCQLSIVRKEEQKKSLFGFAVFETSEQVDELLLNRESLKLNDKALDVNRAVPKTNTWHGAHEKTKKLFIANLPRNTTEEELREYFKARHPTKYGEVESIKLIKKRDTGGTENLGYGFIEVSCEDLADKMAIQHNHFTFGGRNIELKKHVPSAGGGGGRGRGRGGRGAGGGQFQQRGGFNNGFGGQQWGADSYGADAGFGYGGGFSGYGGGFGGGFGGGYGGGYGGGFGGGYGAPRGRGARFTPY